MQSQLPGSNQIGVKPAVSVAGHFAQFLLRSFRWAVITNWFLFLLAAVLVGGSLLASIHTDAWHWFQRSGALMVSIGAILSTRRPLGLILEGMIEDHSAATARANFLAMWPVDITPQVVMRNLQGRYASIQYGLQVDVVDISPGHAFGDGGGGPLFHWLFGVARDYIL